MLVTWDKEFANSKDKIFKFGPMKLVVRFKKLTGRLGSYIEGGILWLKLSGGLRWGRR